MKPSLFGMLASILLLSTSGMGKEIGPTYDSKSTSESPVSFITNKDAVDPAKESDGIVDSKPTPSATEGPYFKSGSSERRSLLDSGIEGESLILTGQVMTRSGKPISGAILDFWQADGNGRYDNDGYMLRGHQLTDEQGRYQLETVIPGSYGSRTKHIHVKVQVPGEAMLTTQLFFPEENNQRDSIFRPELLVSLNETKDVRLARFDFVLDIE